MNNEFIFIRHAKTKMDKDTPIEKWGLSEEGEKQSQEIVNSSEFENADILISSEQDKAYLTIKPLADKLGKTIIKIKELGEIKRPDSEKLSSEEYQNIKNKIFGDLDFKYKDWETPNEALSRFKQAIEELDQKYENKKIIIASHGTVMSLYFAYLLGELSNLIERRKSLNFGTIGIIKNNKVVRDII